MTDGSDPLISPVASEGLALELKAWLDPHRAEHRAVLARTLIALRNQGGGSLFVGFKDDGHFRSDDPPFDVATGYHSDRIQELVSRYASDHFEVNVTLLRQNGRLHPRLEVPAGIRTPVRVKEPIVQERDGKSQVLLRRGEIPVRTLRANGRPSTAECEGEDWERLMRVCFENREADVGRFIRRHLGGVAPAIADLVQAIREIPIPDDAKAAADYLELGAKRFALEYNRRTLPDSAGTMLMWGAREVSLVISPAPQGFEPTQEFLRRMVSTVPRLTTYPPWVDAVAAGGVESGAQVREGRWEALFHNDNVFDLLTFDMLDPPGRFYERRVMLPDVIARENGAKPREVLGERETITDVAETLVTGLAFAAGMGVADEHHTLHWGFRWSGLAGRLVDRWFMRGPTNYIAEDDFSPVCLVSFAADTPEAALAPMIREATAAMFVLFRGYSVPPMQIDETLAEVLERRSRF